MKRTVVLLLLGLFTSFSVFAEMGVVTEEVAYFKGNTKVKGFLASPATKGSYPALILIHEWWGLNENIKDFARKFAALGYVALAVDLYDGELATTPDEAQKLAGAVRNNVDGAFANLNQAVAFLKSRSDSVNPERLAAVGWCFGGGWSYQMAKNNLGVKASVMYYGQFSPKDDLAMMRAMILGHFGEKDMGIKVDTVKEFQASLKTLNGNHEVYIYPNAGHAFANDSGPNYNKEAADLAWTRTQEFLNRYL